MAGTVQVALAAQATTEGWFGAPWAFWSGLIGSAVTATVAIVTLLLSNAQNSKRQATQLENDAIQKQADRKLSIRREVYLAAVEETLGVLATIGGLPQRGIDPSSDGEALQGFLKATAKIWLVADPEAAHLSRTITSEFSELFLNAMVASMPARYAMEPVRLREKEIQHEESEAIRLQVQFNDARAKNAPKVEQDRLGELLQESHQWIDELKRQRDAAREASAPIAFEAFRATFGEVRSVQRTLTAMVSSLRHELGLPRDDEQFAEELRDMERRAWATMNRLAGNNPPVPMPEIVERPSIR